MTCAGHAYSMSTGTVPAVYGMVLNQWWERMLAWAAVVVFSAYWILHSRWGRAFRAIRENEMRAEALGVSLRNYKLMAFAIGAAYAGIGGALFAPLLGYIDAGAFTLDRSIQFLMMVVMGGLGRFEGPFIGAILVTVLPEVLRASEGLYLVFYAIAVILMMLFMPKGLVGRVGLDHAPAGAGRRGVSCRPPAAGRHPADLSRRSMPLLEVDQLTKQFFRLPALSGVSLSVEAGDLLGVIGPNGSGKTTLFNCVTGVLRPTGGHVRFKGEDITRAQRRPGAPPRDRAHVPADPAVPGDDGAREHAAAPPRSVTAPCSGG